MIFIAQSDVKITRARSLSGILNKVLIFYRIIEYNLLKLSEMTPLRNSNSKKLFLKLQLHILV